MRRSLARLRILAALEEEEDGAVDVGDDAADSDDGDDHDDDDGSH